ncbi:uncharacterized protein [Typha angustifolia]|uniref:uncharacterized protein n=1 Tax=Typha angustifolia TaxID=59011 RepID=UPI003C2FBEC9
MGVRAIQCLIFLLVVLFCSGTLAKESDDTSSTSPASLQTTKLYDSTEKPVIQRSERKSHRLLSAGTKLESESMLPQMDVVTPIATVPVVNPSTNPTVSTTPTYPSYNPISTPSSPTPPMMTPVTNPYSTPSTPSMVPPSSSGQSWCIASQTASETALQVALDYACGYGGADCSAIQQGGSCFNPDTLRDHASYAFNNYYQKNPVPTSCDFGGTAVTTNIDPSSSTCQYPSTSTSSSVLNTTNPTGSTVFGSVPPATTSSASKPKSMIIFIGLMLLLNPLISLNVHK